MTAKLGGALPKGAGNGLDAIAQQLISEPNQIRVAVVLFDCSKVVHDTDTGDQVPTARVRRIEPITDETDGQRLRQVLRRAWERRTGQDVLPLDLEDQINEAFGIETGEDAT